MRGDPLIFLSSRQIFCCRTLDCDKIGISMESKKDVRWEQRFSNYQKALKQLQNFLSKDPLSELEEQGLIQAFEYTFELAWNTIKDFYESQGESNIQGSKDAFRLAFKRGLITDGTVWMSMIESRIKSSHTYNEEVAKELAGKIRNEYIHRFLSLKTALEKHE